LKREYFGRHGGPGVAFRGFTAAASLKRATTGRRHGERSGGFPRFHRRGLIEARCSGRLRRHRRAAFRGFTAAASLKQLLERRHQAVNGLFPRFHRRGLIEARYKHPTSSAWVA